ncbi:MAG: four helix bundle protein [Limisphaerales bacterium]
MNSPEKPSVFLPHGGYRKLRSYKVAEAVYDATVVFCRRFFARDRRMADQMVQAARSGVRNISEGSGAAATSARARCCSRTWRGRVCRMSCCGITRVS